MTSSGSVSRDGSPLAIYLALPAGPGPLIIHRAIETDASILEIGSGPGRLTRVLIALGHHVVAVDEDQGMLDHVTGAETVCLDLFELDLDRRFDAVVVASHLINRPQAERRRLLAVCQRHVRPGGDVLVERFPPGWIFTAERTVGDAGPVRIIYEPGEERGTCRMATVTYELADRSWQQHFEAMDVSDEALGDDCEHVGLRVAEVLNDDNTWVRLEAAELR